MDAEGSFVLRSSVLVGVPFANAVQITSPISLARTRMHADGRGGEFCSALVGARRRPVRQRRSNNESDFACQDADARGWTRRGVLFCARRCSSASRSPTVTTFAGGIFALLNVLCYTPRTLLLLRYH